MSFHFILYVTLLVFNMNFQNNYRRYEIYLLFGKMAHITRNNFFSLLLCWYQLKNLSQWSPNNVLEILFVNVLFIIDYLHSEHYILKFIYWYSSHFYFRSFENVKSSYENKNVYIWNFLSIIGWWVGKKFHFCWTANEWCLYEFNHI